MRLAHPDRDLARCRVRTEVSAKPGFKNREFPPVFGVVNRREIFPSDSADPPERLAGVVMDDGGGHRRGPALTSSARAAICPRAGTGRAVHRWSVPGAAARAGTASTISLSRIYPQSRAQS